MTPAEAVALAARLRCATRRFYNAPWLLVEAAEAIEQFADEAAARVGGTVPASAWREPPCGRDGHLIDGPVFL